MSAATAIGSVSTSLQNLLRDEMTLQPPVNVTLLAPDESAAERRVNLFLYRVDENPYLKSQDPVISPIDPTRLLPPPLSLDLFYLMTVYAPNDADTGNAEAHHILGDAMRVLHDNSPIPAEHLSDDLRGARERLQVTAHRPDAEELNHIWTTFSKPFRPSVMYQVSTVQLDGPARAGSVAAQRVRSVGVPEVGPPPEPPTITAMTPAAGGAGTSIAFTGDQLAGRRAKVTFGAVALPEPQTDSGSITIAVPPGLSPGFYEIRLDVGLAFRRTFLFEVTP